MVRASLISVFLLLACVAAGAGEPDSRVQERGRPTAPYSDLVGPLTDEEEGRLLDLYRDALRNRVKPQILYPQVRPPFLLIPEETNVPSLSGHRKERI